jgi:D-lyxose ketol-isomerase
VITRAELEAARRQAGKILSQVSLSLRPVEIEQMEVVDFGLSELELSGAQILTLVDTERIAVKLLVMLPNQTEPEHRHPPLGGYVGKEETIRCEWGELYLYEPGEPVPTPRGHPPQDCLHTYTVWHEHVLCPGNQVTLQPNTPHWFQAGPDGAVIWSFSTKAVDVQDVFTDPAVRRVTVIKDE